MKLMESKLRDLPVLYIPYLQHPGSIEESRSATAVISAISAISAILQSLHIVSQRYTSWTLHIEDLSFTRFKEKFKKVTFELKTVKETIVHKK